MPKCHVPATLAKELYSMHVLQLGTFICCSQCLQRGRNSQMTMQQELK